jgi:DNA-binding transcriptional LysR family regulator
MEVLVALVAAGESKTRAEAAEKLKISISALDKRLRTASSLYGVPLVQQRGDELTLTDEGQLFYKSAVSSVELASYAEESLRTNLLLKTHHVLVGHSSYLAPALLAMIHGLKLDGYPRVEIDHSPGLTGAIAEEVRQGALHAGFGFLPLTAPELVIRKIWDEPLVVCIPSPHSLAARSVIRAADLEGQSIIAIGREPMPGMHDEIEEQLKSMGVSLRVAADAFAPTEALNLVEQQVGLCILGQSSAMPHRGVTVRPLWTRAVRRQSAFFHREDSRSPLVSELSKTVLQQAKELGRARRQVGKRPA